VNFLVGGICKPYLGLRSAEYVALTRELTTITHNAWKIDFNKSLDQYAKTDLRGVCSLLDLAAECINYIWFNFISTIGAVRDTPKGQIIEQVGDESSAAQPMGYTESNFVAERLVAVATDRDVIDATICRIGQVAGSTTEEGVWSGHDWFPTLVACSAAIGKLSDSLGTFSTID
jgi:thioester reductase-like protein